METIVLCLFLFSCYCSYFFVVKLFIFTCLLPPLPWCDSWPVRCSDQINKYARRFSQQTSTDAWTRSCGLGMHVSWWGWACLNHGRKEEHSKIAYNTQTRILSRAKEMFPDEDFVFQNGNASCYRQTLFRICLLHHICLLRSVQFPDFDTVENLWRKIWYETSKKTPNNKGA